MSKRMTAADVAAMGLVLDEEECGIQHVNGMRPHHHVTLPAKDEATRTHACPECGHVHLPPTEPESN